ncbi:MAG: MarR family transcriptional regulator [Acidobacteriota bacterium]|nr:MarR family transcriptional regulator [Acidobacteriota bacterium]
MSKKIPATLPSEHILIGALLRLPAQAIHRRIIADLNATGFSDLRLPHIAVFQYPGPDGENPSILAKRAGMSKQAMNQLLGSLEDFGYLLRTKAPEEGRSRVVRFTQRGRDAYNRISEILRQVEKEWSRELGSAQFTQLKSLLVRVWNSPLVGKES